jgi:D-xylose reductase
MALQIPLADGAAMPAVGLGLWKIDRKDTAQRVVDAVACGYRHLDGACDYGNESEVGEGIGRVLRDGQVAREQLWVTSKLWNTYHRPEHVRGAIERTLRDLQLDSLDLYLIHFPIALRYVDPETRYPPGWVHDPDAKEPRMEPDGVPIAETWGAMERLVERGLTRYIGVSNFGVSLIRDLLSQATIRPAVLQVESHPYLVQSNLLRYCQQEQIAMTAFSPLGAGSYVPLGMATASQSVLEDPIVHAIAQACDRTAAQVVLRWGVQRGTAVIPKTNSIDRLRENLAIDDFSLSQSQMEAISGLDRNQRFNDPGVFCEKAFGRFFPIYE